MKWKKFCGDNNKTCFVQFLNLIRKEIPSLVSVFYRFLKDENHYTKQMNEQRKKATKNIKKLNTVCILSGFVLYMKIIKPVILKVQT